MRSRNSSSSLERKSDVARERKHVVDAVINKTNHYTERTTGGVLLCHFCVMYFCLLVHVYDAMIYRQHENKWFNGKSLYGGRWKFLTYINFWVQLIYFVVSFLSDIITWKKVRPLLQECCTIFFTTLVLPMALFVGASFWAIYAIDRELIYSAANDEYVPFILNHFWHTTVVVCVLVELVVVFHRYPTTKTALAITYIAGCVYLTWLNWVFFVSGQWPYPFLHALPFLPLFFLGVLLISPGMFFCGKLLCYLRWHSRWH